MSIAMMTIREYIGDLVTCIDRFFIECFVLIDSFFDEVGERLCEYMEFSEVCRESSIVVGTRLPESDIHTVAQCIIFRVHDPESLGGLSDRLSGTVDVLLISFSTRDISSLGIRREARTHVCTPSHRLELSLLFFFGIFFFDLFDFLGTTLLDIDLDTTEYC
jgi:hypothetical protein